MAIKGEQANLDDMMEQMLAKPDFLPHELTQFPSTAEDLGVNAAKNLQPLKESYLAAHFSDGHPQVAIGILKQINKPFYLSLFKPQGGNPLTRQEEMQMISGIAGDYKKKHQLSQESLNTVNIAKQMLGIISLADLEDRKKLIIKDNSMTDGDQKAIIKRLKREKGKFRKLEENELLIGAALPNFKETVYPNNFAIASPRAPRSPPPLALPANSVLLQPKFTMCGMQFDDATGQVRLEGDGSDEKVEQTQDRNEVGGMPSRHEEAAIMKKYGGILPRKTPLISKDHERAYFDSADWALGKQGGVPNKAKGPLQALRPKLQPTKQNACAHRTSYASADNDECLNLSAEDLGQHGESVEDKNKE